MGEVRATARLRNFLDVGLAERGQGNLAGIPTSTPDQRDRILLVGAIGAALLPLLVADGGAIGEDRRMRASTSKERAQPLLNCLRAMSDKRARPLMAKFDELVRQHATFREVFGLNMTQYEGMAQRLGRPSQAWVQVLLGQAEAF